MFIMNNYAKKKSECFQIYFSRLFDMEWIIQAWVNFSLK